MYNNTKNVMKHMPASSMIDNYRIAQKEVKEAFKLIISAKTRLKSCFGPYNDRIFPHNFREYNLKKESAAALDIIRRNAWKGIIEKTQIKNLISNKRKNHLEDQLERGELPELDHQTLADMLSDLGGNIDSYFKEAVQEIFNWLRPRRSGYKTNSEYEIGKKVIISDALNTDYCVSLSHYHNHRFVSLDNVFHLLDGKGISKYPNDAVTKIREAIQLNEWECESTYFYFKWYKNGNIHIEFKRLDLLKELNRIGGGNRVKAN